MVSSLQIGQFALLRAVGSVWRVSVTEEAEVLKAVHCLRDGCFDGVVAYGKPKSIADVVERIECGGS